MATSRDCMGAINQQKSIDHQKMSSELHGFPCNMRLCIVLLEPGVNFIALQEYNEISNDRSTSLGINDEVEEDRANEIWHTRYPLFLDVGSLCGIHESVSITKRKNVGLRCNHSGGTIPRQRKKIVLHKILR